MISPYQKSGIFSLALAIIAQSPPPTVKTAAIASTICSTSLTHSIIYATKLSVLRSGYWRKSPEYRRALQVGFHNYEADAPIAYIAPPHPAQNRAPTTFAN